MIAQAAHIVAITGHDYYYNPGLDLVHIHSHYCLLASLQFICSFQGSFSDNLSWRNRNPFTPSKCF